MDVSMPLVLLVIASSIVYVAIAVAIGLLAERRGSSGLLWFALAVFTTPVLALLLLLILTPRDGRGPLGRG